MKVKNTDMGAVPAHVTVIERQDDGSYVGEVMQPHEVGHPTCFRGSVESVMLYLDPTPKQLDKLISLLESGRISLSELDGLGGEHGGYTRIEC